MKFLQRNKKAPNEAAFNLEDFIVLNYEQLLKVNGAGGKSGSGSGSPSGPSTSGNLSDRGYPSSTGGINNFTDPKTWNIKYDGKNGVIRVDNSDPETKEMALKNPYQMAEKLKAEYKEKTGSEYPVSTGSLAAEVYLHADLYSKGILETHTNQADCGTYDKERSVYDIYAKTKGWN